MKQTETGTKRCAVKLLACALALVVGLSAGGLGGSSLMGQTAYGASMETAPLTSESGWQTVSPFNGATYTHSSETAGCTLSNGIDVSKWQGSIDWTAVAADGVQFAIIRCARTSTGSTFRMTDDECFARNVEGAYAAGIAVGVYYFSQATTLEEAQQEADRTIALLEPYRDKITLPVYFDLEVGEGYRVSGLSQETTTQAALTWLERVSSAGYEVGYYGSVKALPDLFDLFQMDTYPCWVARYNAAINSALPHTLWQYTDSGSVNGISGPVDCNFGYDLLGEGSGQGSDPWDTVLGYLEVTGNIYLRSGPGTGYDQLKVLQAGSIVERLSEIEDGWVKLRYVDETGKAFVGYGSAKYLQESDGNSSSNSGDSSGESGDSGSDSGSSNGGDASTGDGSSGGSDSSTSVSGSAVTTGTLYLRSGAGTSYTALTVIPSGTKVTLIEQTDNGWYKLSFTDSKGYKWTGYASGKYLELVPEEETGTSGSPGPAETSSAVTTASLNLRSGPGMSYSVITVLPSGATVTVLNKGDGTWYQVRYTSPRGGSWTGYASAKYLKTVDTGEESSSGSSGTVGTAHTTGMLNLRTGPGTGYDIQTVLPSGATVTVLEVGSNGWNKVTYTNSKGTSWTGWCSAKYLASGAGSSAGSGSSGSGSASSTAVTTASLNLRSGPGAGYSVVTVLPSGASVTVKETESNGWCKITYTSQGKSWSGYVNGKYLKTETGSSSGSVSSGSSGSDTVTGSVTSYAATTTASLNLRSGPGAGYSVVTVLPSGASVTVKETESNGWCKISYTKSGTTWTGYVNGKYLKTGTASGSSGSGTTASGSSGSSSSASYTATTTASLNLRSGPGTGYSSVTVLPSGASVTVKETESNGWCKVSYTKSGTTWTGYVNGKYLKTGTASGSSGSGSSGSSSSGSYPATTTGTLYLRSGPGTGYSAVTVLSAGASVTVKETESNGWCKISYTKNGATWTGYVNGKYLEVAQAKKMTTTGKLYLRSGPGTEYAGLTVVASGSVVTVLDSSNAGWYQITYTDINGKQWTGYLSAKYLK